MSSVQVTPTLANYTFLDCTVCRGTVKGNLNASAYKDIHDNCMLPPLWLQFEENKVINQYITLQLIQKYNSKGQHGLH